MDSSIRWWLGDLADKFEENKSVLKDLNIGTEARLDHEIRHYLSKNPSGSGHGFAHHQRVREFSTMIGITNGYDVESIKMCRYGASIHDILKEVGKGGKGPHNWSKLRELTKDLMKKAKIENKCIPIVIEAIEEHHEDEPSKRSELGNILYEGDTVDITHLPRCFDIAQSVPLYPTMERVIEDYTKYHINPSTPITDVGKRMFGVGKNWALPTLEKLRNKLDNEDLKPYFSFLNTKWRENINEAPEILKETLNTYNETIPHYEINLKC